MRNWTAIDFETYLISDEMPIPKPVCLSYYDGKQAGLLIGAEKIEPYLQTLLSSGKMVIAQNAKFEALVIYKYFPSCREALWSAIEAGHFFCTALYQKLLDNLELWSAKQKGKLSKRYSLAGLARLYLDKDLSDSKNNPDAWRLRYNELDGVPIGQWPEEAKSYAIMDSVYAYQIAEHQFNQEKIYYKNVVEEDFALNLMASTGVLVDKSRVEILEKEVLDKIQPYRDYLVDKGFMVYDEKTGKYKKEIKALQTHIGAVIKNPIITAKGAIKYGKDQLEKYYIENPEDNILKTFMEMAEYEKLLTAFIKRLKLVNTVMRTQYQPFCSTSRTSSSSTAAYPSCNLQQMPRGS